MKPPVFHEGNVAYSADTCSALADAARRGAVNFNAFARGQYPGRPLPNNALPDLRTVGFRNATDEQHWGPGWHQNEGIEVVFLLHGKETYANSTGRWDLKVGDVVVCPPWQLHRIGDPHVGVGTILWFIIDTHIRHGEQRAKLPSWIILSEDDKAKLLSQVFYGSTHVFHLAEKHIQTWKKLYRILLADSKECPVSALAITINELLYNLLELQNQPSRQQVDSVNNRLQMEKAVRVFLDELRTTPARLEHPWTLREMARICGISPQHFVECCCRLTSLSPTNALNQMRIRHAELLIRNEPQKTITEIAMKCGFTTSQYFATVFKKWNGKTPSEFKKDSVQTEGDML